MIRDCFRRSMKWMARSSLSRDSVLSILMGILCILLGGWLGKFFAADSSWEQWIVAGMVSTAVAVPNLFLIHSKFPEHFPAAAPLLATIWRTGTYVGMIVLFHATKWPNDYFALNCFQGCYFPFLLLESGLFIQRVSQQHPAIPPRC